MPELWLPQVRLLPIQQLRYTVPIGIAWPWRAAHRPAPGQKKKSRYIFIYTYTGQRPSMLVVAIGIVLGSTTARILLGGPRGPGSKAWIKRCDYHKSRGDPVALSSHQVATSSPSAHSTTKVLATLQEKTKDEERRPRRTSMEHEEPLPPPAHG